MANPNSVRSQAAAAAGAAVPTRGSINRQYGQSIGDEQGFTTALVHLLQSGPNVGGGYSSAVNQQSGVDQSAQNQLAGMGSPFAAGSAAAVGGLGRSALSSLAAQGAAATAYGRKMPGVAAARGLTGVHSLETARQTALTQRNTDYRQAYTQALQQARTNAFNQKLAMQQLGLSRQQFAFQKQEAAQANAYRYAALAQNQRQFQSSQAQQFQEYLANLRGKVASGSGGGLAGRTPSEISQLMKSGNDYAGTQVLHGVPIKVAIRNVMMQGIPRQIALAEVQLAYSQATRPTKNQFTDNAGLTNHHFRAADYQAALRAYNTVIKSLRAWVNLRQWRQTLRNQPSQGTAPGQGRGIG